MPYKNPETRRAYQKEYFSGWYAKNKEDFKKQVAEANRKRRAKLRAKVNAYKAEKGCNRCPEKNPVCLDFHHVNDKEKTISKMVSDGYSWERILKEIEKCEVLCANCHRKDASSNPTEPA